MGISAKYVHTNLIAIDWRKLADFYINVFGCVEKLPQRDINGKELEEGTGIIGAHLQGMHLRLPGYEIEGPTLEIFSYDNIEEQVKRIINKQGYGHIAFQVDDVKEGQKAVLKAGGKSVGKIVTIQLSNGIKINWCYVTDPEENIIELQSTK
jgi:predicted enzyme related to lactoylglutathione lyase